MEDGKELAMSEREKCANCFQPMICWPFSTFYPLRTVTGCRCEFYEEIEKVVPNNGVERDVLVE